MISIKITTGKIDKSLLFRGQKGTYLNITLKDNKDGQDEYGNDGFVVQEVSKAEREAGKRGPIIGNWKHVGQKPQPKAAPPQKQSAASRPPADPELDPTEDDDVPF